nr:histidine kinase [Bacillus taeanensis]
MSKTAYIEGAERTSDLISSVSALLRYNLGDIDKPTTLSDEVEIVKEYFFIQKTRFGDRGEFEENIDPAENGNISNKSVYHGCFSHYFTFFFYLIRFL